MTHNCVMRYKLYFVHGETRSYLGDIWAGAFEAMDIEIVAGQWNFKRAGGGAIASLLCGPYILGTGGLVIEGERLVIEGERR